MFVGHDRGDAAVELELQGDQELFVETTRRFLETECPLTAVRALDRDPIGFDRRYWHEGAQLGWTTMLVPEAQGGGSVSGAGLLDLALVAEEMGRLVSPGPLLPVNVVADTLARSGSPAQQEAELAPIVAGERIVTWAFSEPDGRWDAAGVTLGADQHDGSWTLSGTKSYVQDAAVADAFLVTARTGDGLTQFLVGREAPGLTASPRQSLDITRRFGEVTLTDVTVDESTVVGRVGDAAADVERQLRVALTVQNAETVGAVNRVYEFTLEYAKDRVAFGRPIGSYQALKHRFADMKMWLEACNATAAASARAVQAETDDASELVSVAASYVKDRAPAMVQDCVQMHGGIGVTWEHDLHLYLRRVAQNAALYGSAREHRERLATLLGV
jgi:alkylation response protein AidB-like acyl-CoA dehydrogenase